MTKSISLILALAMTLWAPSSYAADIHQEVRIGVYGTDGPDTGGDPMAQQPEEYGEANRGVVFEEYKLEAEFENYVLDAVVRDLNKNTRGFKIEGGQPGKTTWELIYDEMPHLYTREARSLYSHAGNGVMKLSPADHANIVTANGGSTYNPNYLLPLVENRPYTEVGVDIKTMGAEVKFRPVQDFMVELSGKRVSKQGTRPQAAAFGFNNAIELAAPVEEDVTSGTLELQLTKPNYQLQFDYTFEDFSNSIYSLTWDNPKRTTPQYTGSHYSNGDGSILGQQAMAPDNKAHMMKLEGGVNLGDRTHLGFEGGYQRWSSFNPMLPYTVNTYINGVAGAPAAAQANTHGLTFDASSLANRPDPNVQGLIEVYTYLAKLTSRPFDWLRGSLIHEAYIMENGGKKYTVPGWAVFDQNWHAETTPINPTLEQFRDDKTSVKTEYDFTSWLSGNTSVSRKYMKKTRAVDKGVEYEVNQGFTIKPAKNLWVNLGFLASGRRANGWDYQHYPRTVSGGVVYFNESPGLMRPDVADRNRQQGRVQVQWMPGDATVNLSARMTDDKYRGGKNQDLTGGRPEIYPDLFGVLSDRHQSVALDTSFAVTKKVDADFFYEYDFHRQFVRSSQTDTRTNIFGAGGTDRLMVQRDQDRWDARFTEHTNVVGAGLTHRPTDKMKNNVGVDLTFTRSNGDPMTLGSRNSAMTPLETSRRVRQTLKAGSQYKFTKNLTLAANYVFDRFQANDFAYTDIPTVMGTSSMFLGADPIKTYLFHSLGMSMTYKF